MCFFVANSLLPDASLWHNSPVQFQKRCPPMSNGKRKLFVFSVILAFIMTGIPSHADTFRPVVRGKRGVVAGGSPLSVEAGLRILQRGGNAVDAGVATILAASVIEFSHFSFR